MEPESRRFQVTEPTGEERYDTMTEPSGSGWIVFASIILAIAGVYGLIWGLVGYFRSAFFVDGARYVFWDLRVWSWIIIGFSIVTLIASGALLSRAQWARWFAITIAGLSMIANMMAVQAYPIWSLLLIGLNILIIYGLAAHGRRTESMDRMYY
jgi:hypothetical protein